MKDRQKKAQPGQTALKLPIGMQQQSKIARASLETSVRQNRQVSASGEMLDRYEAAVYIRAMLVELKQIAETAQIESLIPPLELSITVAENAIGRKQ